MTRNEGEDLIRLVLWTAGVILMSIGVFEIAGGGWSILATGLAIYAEVFRNWGAHR